MLAARREQGHTDDLIGTIPHMGLDDGDAFQLWLGANRDPDTFTDPDVIDFGRPNAARHVAFGAGPHHCLGSHLARREIRLSLEAIAGLERFDLVPGTDVRFKPAFARGPKTLPLIFGR